VLFPLIVVSLLAGIGIGIGFILIIIPGLVLMTFWAVVAPVVVIERPGIFAAFGRSYQLVKGNAWQVFGVILLFGIIFFVISLILGIIGAAIGDAGEVILGYVGRVLTAPLLALASATLYFELRDAKGETAAAAVPGAPGTTGSVAGLSSDAPVAPGSPPPPPPAPGGFTPPTPPPPPPGA
jgi:hypothetical protein